PTGGFLFGYLLGALAAGIILFYFQQRFPHLPFHYQVWILHEYIVLEHEVKSILMDFLCSGFF
ncbi:MAG TPA: hypothetical protein PLI41_08290, partial [Bacteroidales bacterium]|nr:hypothetical protein [Bacteroidales bacterium]